ncbi:MAG: hypothetical protein H7A46_26195 [Verrucomicrobiales bacterium]|nr:hypothetical protein [Verrucomicrobiales bacterium]
MDHREQGQHHRSSAGGSSLPGADSGKKNATPLLTQWEQLWGECALRAATADSCQQRLREHLLAHLVCPGRHTLSGLIAVFGRQFQDWTGHYSLYAKDRVDPAAIFGQVRREVEALGLPDQPLCVALDDTILRKRGRFIPGAAFRRDPLGPAFQVNLVWAQREQALSAAVPDEHGDVRMVPIGFRDASTPRKPRCDSAPELFERYREEMKQRNLNVLAIDTLAELQRQRAHEQGGPTPPLRVLVDGSYTNSKVVRHLPENTALIGRIRKDARLHAKPEPPEQTQTGRRRVYGKRLLTPEKIRQDDSVPWQPVRARVNGKTRKFEVKTLAPVRSPIAGATDLRLVIIRPIGFRPRRGARLAYTQPAYLICTDPQLPLQDILQEYVWRWDIELNHRDEKTILGVGQAQVRNPHSAQSVPATAVAAYALLLVAAIRAYGKGGKPAVIPEAKWRKPDKKIRPSTQDLINELRRELWAKAIRPDHLSDFMNAARHRTKPLQSGPNLCSSLFAATA